MRLSSFQMYKKWIISKNKLEYFHIMDYFHIFGHNTRSAMFQNEISDKLQFFAKQGMDREMHINDRKTKKNSGRSVIKKRRIDEQYLQLKLF